ncbi:hypothetical protein BH11ACT8_BH11ACT8_30450 [soil metagenome]
MCFSMQADLVAGAVLAPLGVLSLAHVRRAREVPLAALPLLFAAHQLVESLVWAGFDGDVSATTAERAAWAYAIFALPVLPLLVPLAILLVVDRLHRRRVAPFVALGAAVSVVMARQLIDTGLTVSQHPHAIGYYVGFGVDDWLWTSLYVVACMGVCLVSGERLLQAFGIVNLVGLSVVAYAYAQAFASLWCVYAACSSVLLLAFMVQRSHRHADAASGGLPERIPQA